MLRVDLRFGDDDTVADILTSIPRADRPSSLRILIRRHFHELPEIAGVTPPLASPTPARPTPVAAAAAPVTDAATPAPAARPDRAAMARRLCKLGAHTAKPVAALAVAALLACAIPARQARAGTLDLDVTTSAIHTRAWARKTLNQRNPGIGLEYHLSRTWGLMGGVYKNSYRRPTWYTAATFTPLHIGTSNGWRLDAGVVGGIATGYGHAHYDTYGWVADRASPTGWRLVTNRHRYMRNPLSPLMAAGIVRVRAPDGLGVNVLLVPNQPHGGSGFVGFQLAFPLP